MNLTIWCAYICVMFLVGWHIGRVTAKKTTAGEDSFTPQTADEIIQEIESTGFRSYAEMMHYCRLGLSRFVGDHRNEKWQWISDELSKLDTGTLKEIRRSIKEPLPV